MEDEMAHVLMRLCLAFVTCLVGCMGGASRGCGLEGRVTKVVDGDTLHVRTDAGDAVKVRLAEIDSPEKRQPFGASAQKRLKSLCGDKEVCITVRGRDRYGRMLGTVHLKDGTNLNELLVKEGCAWHYKAYSKSKTLADLELKARKESKGLWAMKSPTAPWEWRKAKGHREAFERF